MKLQKKNRAITELSLLDTPFTRDAQYDILGLILATIVGFTSTYIARPEGTVEWTLKILEILGILFAGWAIGLMINKFKQNKALQQEKLVLEERAKSKHLTLNKYLSKILEDISKPIRKWADLNNVEYNYLKYSNYKHTIDFHDFPIDYIDIQIADYHLEFLIRMHDTDYIKRMLKHLTRSEIKLVLILDQNHLGNLSREKIEERSIEKIKHALIESIIGPAHSIKRNLFV